MVYTCAYYRDPDGDLATAQEDKLDLVCRKLRLEPGGIIEHVGPAGRAAFLASLWSRLRPGGLLLNQGITHRAGWRPTSLQRFLDDQVFPNGALDHVSAFLEDAERRGFELLDVESLRPHYARTCRQWTARLQENAAAARALVGERIYRTWLTYLASASVAFEQGSIDLYQSVLRKPDPAARPLLPTTREDLYRPRAAADARRTG